MNKSRLFKYLAVGITAYIIEMLSLYIFNSVAGLGSVYSVALSFWVGFFVAFVMQKIITFGNYEKDIKKIGKQLFGYSILVLFNYMFTLIMVHLFMGHISVYIVRTLVIMFTTIWNYIIYIKLFK